MSKRMNRFHMERLEARQLMARNTGVVDSDPVFDTGEQPPGEPLPFEEVVVASPWRPSVRTALQSPESFDAPEGGGTVGDITATLLGGNLYLGEAAGQTGLANGVSISRLANGNIVLAGHDPTNSGGPSSLINGMASVEFAVTGSLFSNLGNGENQIVFNEGPGGMATFQDAAFNGGSDVDRFIINALQTRGSLSFNTGAGDDWVFVSGSTIGDGFGWDVLSVNSGAGADTVTVKNGTRVNGAIDIQTYDSLGELDSDTVYFDTEAFAMRDVNVRTGGGDDTLLVTKDYEPLVFFSGLETNGSLLVDMGAGDDTAYLRGVKTNGDFQVYTGAGADDVTIDNRVIERLDGTFFVPRVGGNLDIQTYDSLAEGDADAVRIYDATITGSLLARLGGGNDTFLMEDAEIIGNDLDLDMGAGDDTTEISAFVLDHLMARMGEGNDTLKLGKTWAYRLIADGGLGGDSLTKTTQTKAQFIDQFGWETINGWPTWWDDIVFDLEDGVLSQSP